MGLRFPWDVGTFGMALQISLLKRLVLSCNSIS